MRIRDVLASCEILMEEIIDEHGQKGVCRGCSDGGGALCPCGTHGGRTCAEFGGWSVSASECLHHVAHKKFLMCLKVPHKMLSSALKSLIKCMSRLISIGVI